MPQDGERRRRERHHQAGGQELRRHDPRQGRAGAIAVGNEPAGKAVERLVGPVAVGLDQGGQPSGPAGCSGGHQRRDEKWQAEAQRDARTQREPTADGDRQRSCTGIQLDHGRQPERDATGCPEGPGPARAAPRLGHDRRQAGGNERADQQVDLANDDGTEDGRKTASEEGGQTTAAGLSGAVPVGQPPAHGQGEHDDRGEPEEPCRQLEGKGRQGHHRDRERRQIRVSPADEEVEARLLGQRGQLREVVWVAARAHQATREPVVVIVVEPIGCGLSQDAQKGDRRCDGSHSRQPQPFAPGRRHPPCPLCRGGQEW